MEWYVWGTIVMVLVFVVVPAVGATILAALDRLDRR